MVRRRLLIQELAVGSTTVAAPTPITAAEQGRRTGPGVGSNPLAASAKEKRIHTGFRDDCGRMGS